MICVVGNCMSQNNNVKRCYWSAKVAKMRDNILEHAYLDLCSFHQGMFESHTCSSWQVGWDAI